MSTSDPPDAFAPLAEVAPPPPGDRLLAAVGSGKPASPRRPADTFAFTLVVSMVFASVAFSVMGGPRGDLATLPRAAFLAVVLLCGAAFVAALYLALVPARRQVMPRARLAGRVGIIGALAAALAHVIFAALVPEQDPAATHDMTLLQQTGACIALGALAAIAPTSLALLMLRRVIGLGGVALGVAIGGAAGALGGLFLHLRCDIPGVLHAGLSHGPAILLPAALLLALLRLALGRRTA